MLFHNYTIPSYSFPNLFSKQNRFISHPLYWCIMVTLTGLITWMIYDFSTQANWFIINPNQSETSALAINQEDESDFVARNIVFWRNDETIPTKLFYRKNLESIVVNFQLEGSNEPKGIKDIYLVFENVVRKQTFQSETSRSSNFSLNGQEVPYTVKIIVDYQGTTLNVSIPIYQDSHSRFEAGAYDAFIYHDGRLLGKQRLAIGS